MIFVTVGAQLPFDRLIRAVDQWADCNGRTDIFAQVGETKYEPEHIEWTRFLKGPAFRERVQEARVLVAHAGMGSILTALEHGKPILIMPRRAELNEHRNDHQLATARHYQGIGGVHVAMQEADLEMFLDSLDEMQAPQCIQSHASHELLARLRSFLDEVSRARGK